MKNITPLLNRNILPIAIGTQKNKLSLLLLLLLCSSAAMAQPAFTGTANKPVAEDASKYHSSAVGLPTGVRRLKSNEKTINKT